MPRLTKDELQKILQLGTVDAGNDTLFSRTDKLKVDRSHLTLVISSGGSGASAIKEAIATAKQKLEEDFAVFMKFIMVDSASKELEALANSLGRKQLQILNISTNGAQQRLNAKPRDDFYQRFVPGNYETSKLNKDGSGRDRMTGKIKFYDEASTGNYNDVVFRNMISSLFADGGDWSAHKDKPVDIMILAGLSGGNGSGTFEDLAAHARYACEQSGASVRVFGYLFLPDTVEEFEKNDPTAQKALYTNGYAALKELESYMSIPFNPERKEYFYSRDGVTKIECSATSPLFNYPVLISGGYKESKAMMAESILNLAIASDGSFDQDSFYSNSIMARNTYLADVVNLSGGLLKKDFYPEDSHSYAAIGYAYAAIPNEIVTANVVSNVSQKLYVSENRGDGTNICFCTEKRRLDRFEMETQIRRLFSFDDKEKLKTSSLWDKKIEGALKKASLLTNNDGEITRAQINNSQTAEFEKGFHKEQRVIKGTEEMLAHLNQIFTGFKEKAEEVIKDYGPKAIELLYTGKGPDNKEGKPEYYDIAIKSMLDYAKGQFIELMTETKKPRPENNIPGGLIQAVLKTKVNEWKVQFHSALEAEAKQEITKNLMTSDGAWERNIVQPIVTYVDQCQDFAERLELLTNFYHSEGSPLDSGDYSRFLDASRTGNCVNLCNSADIYSWVKGEVTRKINSVGISDVKAKLVESFKNSPELWTSEAEGKTRAEFDRVMSNCCQLGKGAGGAVTISLSATSYFEHVLDQVDSTEVGKKADEIVKDIIEQLKIKSKPALKKMGGYSAENRFIMIPESLKASRYGVAIESAFRNALHANGTGKAEMSVSSSVSDIVCYQTSVANGLCDLTEVMKWETVYNEGASKNTRHLNNGEFGGSYVERTKSEVEKQKAIKEERKVPELGLSDSDNIIFGTGLSWEHYPPIALRNQENNRSEVEFRKQIFDPIVNYAMKEKIIQRKKEAGSSDDVYQYVINLIPKGWVDLDVSNYRQKGDDGKFERGEVLFQYLANQNTLVQAEYQKPILLTDSGRFGEPYNFLQARTSGDGKTREIIEDISKQYMKRILRKNTELFLELRETLCRYYEIVKDLEIREQEYWYAYQVEQFARYYGFGIIMEEEGKWFALTDDTGNRQAFCSFTYKETNAYNDFEKKLYKGDWRFLLAFKKFTEIDQKKLKIILDDMLNDMDQEELENLRQINCRELGKMCSRIKKDIVNKYPNRTTDDAIRKTFDIGNNAGVFYVKVMESMLEQWEEYISDEDSAIENKQKGGAIEQGAWRCMNCGETNPDKAKRCMECGKEKGWVPPAEEWECKNCGTKNPERAKRCMECGKEKGWIPPTEEWECKNCGTKNPERAKRCMECGKEKGWIPSLESEEWICTECGEKNPAKAKCCIECGAKRK